MGGTQSCEEFVDQQIASLGYGNALSLGELYNVRLPDGYPVDLQHLATVYAADTDKDGTFSRDDLCKFAVFYSAFRSGERTMDAETKFQALTTLRLWNDVSGEGGIAAFVAWIEKLTLADEAANARAALLQARQMGLEDDGDPAPPPQSPGAVSQETVRDLHLLFSVRSGLGLDSGAFLDLLIKASDTHDAAEPVAPLETPRCAQMAAVLEFATQFINGFFSFLTDLGFYSGMALDK